MFYKFLATIQAIVLTAAMVHVYHLQRQINNNTIKFQLQENSAIDESPALMNAPHIPAEDYELLPDIQTIQDEILSDGADVGVNHSAALFGDMRDKGSI